MRKKITLILALSLAIYIGTVAVSDVSYAAAGNSQYSLSGARYQLYTNAACTAAATDANGGSAILTTGADGKANTLKMNPGTYYAKEITASKGYRLDPKVYTVVVTESNTSTAPVTLTSAEPPAFGTPEFIVFKTDALGAADYSALTGAEFTVKYYDVAEKSEIAGISPKDQWTFRTVKKDAPEEAPEGTYWAGFDWQNDDPVSSSRSGDDLFYTGDNGKRVLPLGWFTIEETAAPEGFRLTDRVCYGHIYLNSNGDVVTELEGAKIDSRLQKSVIRFENEQTPQIGTTASIQKDNTETLDVVSYEGLIPGQNYVVRGWLVDTVTGEKVQGSDGSAELSTENTTSGQVEVTLKTEGYDGIQGHSMTAFEELYLVSKTGETDKETLVADHKDINNKNQTVGIYQDIKIQKKVTGNLGDRTKEFEYIAEFTGLEPEQSYTVEGYDSKTFNADPSGNAVIPLRLMDDKSVTIKQLPKGAQYCITETASDHVARFEVFSENMADKGAKIAKASGSNEDDTEEDLTTAFETVDILDGTVVVAWENSKGQTLRIPPDTGDNSINSILIYAGMTLASAAALAAYAAISKIHKRRTSQK